VQSEIYRKSGSGVPPGYFAWEAMGLRWLRVSGGAPVVDVLRVEDSGLELRHLASVPATREAAHAFGQRLAVTHEAGAPAYGSPPAGWVGDGFFGPVDEPLGMPLRPVASWGAFWAEQRLLPMVAEAIRRRELAVSDGRIAERVAARLVSGEFDTGEPPARIHGDLWSGNIMWTADGATLIDPAAHGGHRETDLAMLALFGAPQLRDIVEGYQECSPLAPGWAERVALHQVHALLVHAVLFGGGYAMTCRSVLARYA